MKPETPRRRTPVSLDTDRNFDDLAPRFARNVYGGLKGEIRLSVLRRDFAECLLQAPRGTVLRILDAGGGQGQFSLPFAADGHELTLCDISEEMLQLARDAAETAGVAGIRYVHGSVQDLAREVREGREAPYDLLICHSVLEWVADQAGLLGLLSDLVLPGGHLSLSFYNRHGLIMKNLLRGRRPPILDGAFKPSAGSLTPTRPLDPAWVLQTLGQGPWKLLCHSGIRVFHDFLLTPEGRAMPQDRLLALELELSRQEPYRSLGRYQHVLLKRLLRPGQTE